MTARPRLPHSLLALLFLASPLKAQELHDCVIQPTVTARLGSPIGGILDSVLVERGDFVQAGDPVARLRSDIEQADLAIATEQAASDSDIKAQEARLRLAQTRRDRLVTLVDRKISAQDELDEAESALEVIRRELAMAETRQRMAQLELRRAQALVDQRTIRSPVSGVVVDRGLSAGEYVSADAAIVTVAQLDPLSVEAFLPVDLSAGLEVGRPVEVLPDAPIGGSHRGELVLVDRVFDTASQTFAVRARIANPDLAIPAGHLCQLRILPDTAP